MLPQRTAESADRLFRKPAIPTLRRAPGRHHGTRFLSRYQSAPPLETTSIEESKNYWLEALDSSLDEHAPDTVLSNEQLEAIAKDMALAQENYGMAFHPPENPMIEELKRTRATLKEERDKVGCQKCMGRGRLTFQGPYHSSNSQCDRCHGEGKHAP